MRKNQVKVHCKSCNKELFRSPSLIKDKNFCNHRCYSLFKKELWTSKNNPRYSGGKKEFKCFVCGKEFSRKGYGKNRNSKTQLCSQDCYGEYRSRTFKREKHWNWKGGISRTTKIIRSLKAYRVWRENVFERYNHSCSICKTKDKLHIHHKIGLAKIIKDIKLKNNNQLDYKDKRLFDVDNGIVLCVVHHRLEHKKMGRIAGTPYKVA